jgi:hypothetical protein
MFLKKECSYAFREKERFIVYHIPTDLQKFRGIRQAWRDRMSFWKDAARYLLSEGMKRYVRYTTSPD